MYGIIGGSGLTNLPELIAKNQLSIETPDGHPSGPILIGEFDGAQVAFLPRHGPGHTIAPHLINYRANIWALRNAGVDEIVSVASVGGIRSDMGPETIMLPDQLIDLHMGKVIHLFSGWRSRYARGYDRAILLDSASENCRCSGTHRRARSRGRRLCNHPGPPAGDSRGRSIGSKGMGRMSWA